MQVTLSPRRLAGSVPANPSKSAAHRALIAAALASEPTELASLGESEDILATQGCLHALADALGSPSRGTHAPAFGLVPATAGTAPRAVLDCRESGSTLRFLMPVAAALGVASEFLASGRLPARPLGPLADEMARHGVAFPNGRAFPLQMEGRLSPGRYSLPGDVSSQYFTGLLFALPLLDGDSEIRIETPLQSVGYIDLTLSILRAFGVEAVREPGRFLVRGRQRYRSPGRFAVEADWSSAAFWLCAGALGSDLASEGLDPHSTQGDRAVMDVLARMGATVGYDGKGRAFARRGAGLHGCEIDVSQIPDLMPALAVVAAAAKGETLFVNAARLRIKESDRLGVMADIAARLGAEAVADEDSLRIRGTGGALRGGHFSSHNDHRIAMSLAIAATLADGPVVIDGAEAVAKSYPGFWETYRSLTPPAADYERLLPDDDFLVQEPPAPYRADGRWSERHLQCVWYDDRLRPAPLRTETGEEVVVESCGRWNLEAGPDFLDAVLLVGPERRRVSGDVEVHIRPSGWAQHGHVGDPRYGHVVAHVTYYPGVAADLPGGALSISLRDALRALPRFSFDDIDLAAFPHAVIPATPRPCQRLWGDDPDRGMAILRAAGLHRMEVKRQRMRALMEEVGDPAQALYESVMAALGYKNNAPAFRAIARSLPLPLWDDAPTPLANYARLLGVGGLLPDISDLPADATDLPRTLWGLWWRNPAPVPEHPLPWRLDGLRPLNRPFRRLAAAAALFSRRAELLERIGAVDPADPKALRSVEKILVEVSRFPEVEPLLSLGGPAGKPAALLGTARAAAIVTNAVIPYLAATGNASMEALYDRLPPEEIGAPARAMANRLFGRDHNPRVLYEHSGLLQQGLLQIFSDFCLNDRSGCAECRFGRG